jgi:hypothetical protein
MIRTVTRLFTISALMLPFGIASSASAQILDLASGGNVRSDGGKVVGISLNSFGTTLTSLGFYDHDSDGISGTYQLGLWDASQTLVRTATVTPLSPLTDGFRYASIAPFTLDNPETFTIGVLLPENPPDVWLGNASMILFVGYSGAGTGQFSGPSGTLVYPNNVDIGNNYYVVNANGPAPPLVPEPASIALVTLAALLGLTARRRTKA